MIDLHTTPTANGFRASIMLEETGFAYTVHVVDLAAGEQKRPAFLAINPTGRVPAIVDHDVDGPPFALSETFAIALYLAEKSGSLIPSAPAERALAWQWGATVVSGFGSALPGIFFARQIDAAAHARLIDKFYADIALYLGAMDQRLSASAFLAGPTYSFADVLAFPTIKSSLVRFEVDLAPYPAVVRWRDGIAMRPAVSRGMGVS